MSATGAGTSRFEATLAAAGAAGSSVTFTHGLGRRALAVTVVDQTTGRVLSGAEAQVTQPTTSTITVANLGSAARNVRVQAMFEPDSTQDNALLATDSRLSAGVGPAAVPAAPAQHALEQASGAIDGVNTAFAVSVPYIAGSPFLVFWDGVLQNLYPGFALTLSSPSTGAFTQTAPPVTVQRVTVLFWRA